MPVSNPTILVNNGAAQTPCDDFGIARQMAAAGVPIFLAEPAMVSGQWDPKGGHDNCGYWLPKRWHNTVADPAVIDRWRPGVALCAVQGHITDVLDVDPRNGGSDTCARMNGHWPVFYGRQATPSGGTHDFIAPLHVGSHDGIAPGIDLKGGRPDGSGRGFVFLAPTVKMSKTDNVCRAYRWQIPPYLTKLAGSHNDVSGRYFASLAPKTKGSRTTKPENAQNNNDPFFDRSGIFTPEQANNRIRMRLDSVTYHARWGWAGFRDTLIAASYEIGGFVGAGHLSYSEAEQALRQAICYASQPDAKVVPNDRDEMWIQQGLEDGAAKPWRIEEVVVAGKAELTPWHVSVPSPVSVSQEHYRIPLSVLPPVMRDFVESSARSVQVPPEFTFMAALGSVSFVTGGRVKVAFSSHQEPVGIYSALLAPSSERKSPALAVAENAMKRAISQFWDSRRSEQELLIKKIGAQQKRINELEGMMAKPDGMTDTNETMMEKELEVLSGFRAQVMHKPVWSITDATIEALELTMAENGGVAASFADEGSLLATIGGRYSNGPIDLGSVNQAWSGRHINTVRMDKSKCREIPSPFLVLCQFVQPERFVKLMEALQQGDGFHARWLICEPPLYGPRTVDSPSIDFFTEEGWVDTLLQLLERFWGRKQVTSIRLSPEVQKLYREIFAEVDAERMRWQKYPLLAQWLGKAASSHVGRIALLLELAHNPAAQEISREAMSAAIGLYRSWLRPEAFKAIAGISGEVLRPETEEAALRAIAKERTRARSKNSILELVTLAVLGRNDRRFRDMKPAAVAAVLTHLETQGWLKLVPPPGGRRKDLDYWEVRDDFEAALARAYGGS